MTRAQQKAVSKYRSKQKTRGYVRMEVSIPERDREMVKAVAANLRAGGDIAENTRNLLKNIQNPYIDMNFKEFLEAAPVEGLDLDRSTDMTPDVDR